MARPDLTFQNKFIALAYYPKLPSPSKPKLLKPLCFPQQKLINQRPRKTLDQEASPSVIQTKANYVMKTLESFPKQLTYN